MLVCIFTLCLLLIFFALEIKHACMHKLPCFPENKTGLIFFFLCFFLWKSNTRAYFLGFIYQKLFLKFDLGFIFRLDLIFGETRYLMFMHVHLFIFAT